MVLYRTRKDRLSRPIDRADPDDSNEGKEDLILRKTKKGGTRFLLVFSCVVAQAGSAPATPAFSGQCSTN